MEVPSMNRRGQTQKGQFEVQTGMAFTMPALKTILPNGEYIEAQKHPWLIVNTDDDFIEIVMCTTLWSDKENKHRSNKLKYENVTDITNPCPPLDPPNERGSLVMLDTFTTFPKKLLFTHNLQICNTNTKHRNFTTEERKALCLNENEIKYIYQDICEYINKNPDYIYDQFGCYEITDTIYEIQHGIKPNNKNIINTYNQQFAWKHIKPANPYAVYPFEDQMYDYEKQDDKLIKIAKLKKQAHNNKKALHKKREQQAKEKFGNIPTNNPNTGLGLGE